MGDCETVKAMRDANWKPAVTYWKEKCDQADATIARLSEQVNTLTTEKHADAEAIGALREALSERAMERDEAKRELEAMRNSGSWHKDDAIDRIEDAARAEGFAQGIEAAVAYVQTAGDSAVTEALGQQLCCDGHHCGCQGSTVEECIIHHIRALTPPADAPAALKAVKDAARAEGFAQGIEAAVKLHEQLWRETDAYKRDRIRALSPTPQADLAVTCNRCGWQGGEDDLIATLDEQDGEPSCACPECRTDNFLMDVQPEADPVREAAKAGCEPCVICGSPHATRSEMKLPDGQWVCSRPCELAAEAVRKAKDATEFRALAQKGE